MWRIMSDKKSVKQFNMSKNRTDRLQYLYNMLLHYKTLVTLVDKEMVAYVKGEVLPSVGLTAEDFGFCDINIKDGTLDYKIEEKKARDKKKKTKDKK